MTLTRLDLAALRELAEAGGAKAYYLCRFSQRTESRLRRRGFIEHRWIGVRSGNAITEAGRAELIIADAGRAALAKGEPNEPR